MSKHIVPPENFSPFPKRDPREGMTGTTVAKLLRLPVSSRAEDRDENQEGDDWPELQEMGGELPPVPAFAAGWLPASLRPMVEDVAELMQVPLDFPAATALVTLAGLCGRRALIQPKAEDTSWVVVPNLWGAIVGRPGLHKTPAMAAITKVVHAIEAEWRKADETASHQHEAETERAKLDHDVWKKKYKEARLRGVSKLPEPPAQPESQPAAERRLLTSDATPEKLHELMSRNPAGIFVLRDELTGWLAGLERQGHETERTFFLESWDGSTPYALDRIGRGSVYVPHLCLSLFGGIQPARLYSYLTGALGESPDDDGLLQRFQLMVWPDPPASWTYLDRKPNQEAGERAAQVYRRIAELDPANPRLLKFSQDAQKFFIAWLTGLEEKLRDEDLSPSLQAHFAKYRSLMPALALLFALADSSLTGVGFLNAVGLEHAKQAAGLCGYLEQHAYRVYAARISPEVTAAHSLAKRLERGWPEDKEGKKKEVFTAREVYRNGWTGLATPEQAHAALTVLEEAGWVRVSELETGGRPTEIYEINPKIGGRRC